jgi:hypothetical protein
MHDYTNGQELGEVAPGDKLEGPITLANILSTIESNKQQRLAVSLAVGFAIGAGLCLLARRVK